MRPAMLARVLVCGALTASLLHSDRLSQAQAGGGRRQTSAAAKAPPAFTSIVKVVSGDDKASKEGAILSALNKARDEIAKELKLPLAQVPDVDYLRDNCVIDLEDQTEGKWQEDHFKGKRILVKEEHFEDAKAAQEAYQARLRVEVTQKDYAAIVKAGEQAQEDARREVVERRHWWLAKILLGVVVFLGSLSGYTRLEDATKGYYTGWLRLGLVGVLCAVGAGLWLAS